MRQLFFLSETPITQFPQLMGATFHVWTDDSGKSVGVAQMDGSCDSQQVISALEAKGYEWMPNPLGSEQVGSTCAQCLSGYGVLATDTTWDAMNKIHSVSGFPFHQPREF